MILTIIDNKGAIIFTAKSYAEVQVRLNRYGLINKIPSLIKVRSREISDIITRTGTFRRDIFTVLPTYYAGRDDPEGAGELVDVEAKLKPIPGTKRTLKDVRKTETGKLKTVKVNGRNRLESVRVDVIRYAVINSFREDPEHNLVQNDDKEGSLKRYYSYNISSIIRYLIDNAPADKQNNIYRFVCSLGDGMDVPKYTLSTKYVSWNLFLSSVKKMLSDLLAEYDPKAIIRGMTILTKPLKQRVKQIVLGSKITEGDNKQWEQLIHYMTMNEERANKFIEFNKVKKIGSVSSYSRCFLKAVIHSLRNSDNFEEIEAEHDNIRKRIKYSDLSKVLEVQALKISDYLKCRINMYDKDLEIYATYGDQYDDVAEVLTFANHAHYIIKRDGEYELDIYEQHKISPNKSDNDYKYVLGSYDIETFNDSKGNVTPFYLGFKSNEHKYFNIHRHCEGVDIFEEMLNKMRKVCKPINGETTTYIYYAHNGGKFDAYKLLESLLKINANIIKVLPKENTLMSVKVALSKGVIIDFRDSMLIIEGSLDKNLIKFGCDTKKLKIDHSKVHSLNYFREEIKDMYQEYLKCDVEGLLELMNKIENIVKNVYDINLSSCLTSSSISKKYFMNNHNFDEFPIYQVPNILYQKFKPYYIGGRNEVYKKGAIEGDLYYYDFTSAYAHVMAKYDLPYDKIQIIKPTDNEFIDDWFGVVECSIISRNKNTKPFFGIKSDEGLTFKHFDEWTDMITSTENIRYAIKYDLGYEFIFNTVYNQKRGKYYGKVINKCFGLKKDSGDNEPLRAMAKIILCSQYGFWGLKRDDIDGLDIEEFKSKEKKEMTEYALIDKEAFMDRCEVGKHTLTLSKNAITSSVSNIILSMMISDYARMELYDLMRYVESIGGTVYSCDTDAIITDIKLEGNDIYPVKDKKECNLGDLTNEAGYNNKYDSMILLDRKIYTIKSDLSTVTKFRGLNSDRCYRVKNIDEDKRTITYSGISETGHKLEFDDYKLLSDGYQLIVDDFNFTSSLSERDIKYREYTKNFKFF